MTEQVFDQAFLESAGELSITRIERAIAANNQAQALQFLKDLQGECFGMFYSYKGWEKTMLAEFLQRDGEQRAQEELALIVNDVSSPERHVDIDDVQARWATAFKSAFSESGDRLLCSAVAIFDEARLVHDGMMSRVLALLSRLYEAYGEQPMVDVLQRVMSPTMIDPDGTMPFKEKALKLIEYTRFHLEPFRVWEDDVRISFKPGLCPSGGRLVKQGHYQAPKKGHVLQGPSPMTYGRDNLPIYCCHEPAMELAGIEQYGAAVFIVDPAKDIGVDRCHIHIYKNKVDIPDRFYERLGVNRTDVIAVSST